MYVYVSTSEIYLIGSSLPVSWKKNIYKAKQKHWSPYEKQIKITKTEKTTKQISETTLRKTKNNHVPYRIENHHVQWRKKEQKII